VWPGRLPAGRIVNQPLHIADWYPTLVQLAGAKPAAGVPLDGRDLWPALINPAAAPIHDEILINAAPGTGALRRGDWKLVVNGQLRFKGGTPPSAFSWVDLLRESKLPTDDASIQRTELFNLAADPGEARDVSAENPALVRELTARYESYARQAAPLIGGDTSAGFKVPAVWGEFTR
jgi:arylsulfatase A-like enzyme